MDTCRMKFEEWASKQKPPNFSLMPWPQGSMRDDGLYDGPTTIEGQYFAPQTQAAWVGFQAAWVLLNGNKNQIVKLDKCVCYNEEADESGHSQVCPEHPRYEEYRDKYLLSR